MVNRPKGKGTFAESTVAAYLKENGWPYAERRALAGAVDKGDITGTPGLVWEVKYAGAGLRMGEWVGEMVDERANAGAVHGVLVIKPAGRGAKSVDRWFAVMVQDDFQRLWLGADAFGATPLFEREPTGYSASRLGDQLFSITNAAHPEEFAVLTLRPRGLKDTPEKWYRVMTLATVVRLLHAGGYGS